MIAQSLKPRNTTYRLERAGLDVVDIVVVKDSKVWWRDVVVVEASAGVGNAFWVGGQ
jgi:hypothetical protein